MKSIKRALCSVLVCFGTFVFCSSTVNAAESTEVYNTEAADNNFVDNNVTENIVASQETEEQGTTGTLENTETQETTETWEITGSKEETGEQHPAQTPLMRQVQEAPAVPVMAVSTNVFTEQTGETLEQEVVAGGKPSKTEAKKYNKAELRLMSAIIYCEANVEPYAGKLAVGIVIMNRVNSRSFPNTIKKVIYQKSQFSPVRNGTLKKALARYDAGKFKSKDEKQCIKAAKAALDGVKSVTYGGSEKNMKKYHYFSGSLKGSKFRIKGHKFK
ncbi:MAG: cell wall hydrolase [Lachnospiraceae bacterium]|nr:cell wall hydrolase [Lachnospiraceae bacterium]